MSEAPAVTACNPGPLTAKQIVEQLHARCGEALAASTGPEHESILGLSCIFCSDLEAWSRALRDKQEYPLFETALEEYALSVLNVCQGQYRNAFKSLRLVLELCLQGTYLSTNLLLLSEWLKGEQDTNWTALVDVESGIASRRFCKAFFPELVDHVANFREMARKVYRELSECIHGNVPAHIPLPTTLAFDAGALNVWHQKASTVRLVVLFYLSVRYLNCVTVGDRSSLESGVRDQLGHIEAIRSVFGGPTSA